MSILIVGGNGNMGKRYRAILDYLGKRYIITDKEEPIEMTVDIAKKSDGVIIATPSDSHTTYINVLHDLNVPILCEKPITKDLNDLEQTLKSCEKAGTCLDMVLQYGELIPEDAKGHSYYNYFRHGNDGLIWDCIQIVGLASDNAVILEDSPIWQCVLNGCVLNLSDMDKAYVSFIMKWLKKPGRTQSKILNIHKKTHDMAVAHVQSH